MEENGEKVEAFSFLGGEVWVGVVFGEEEEGDGGERASSVSKTQDNTGEMVRSTEVDEILCEKGEDEISRDWIRALWIFISFIM